MSLCSASGPSSSIHRLSLTLLRIRRGDCRRCARVSLSHLVIDGSRPILGRIPNPDYVDMDEIQGLDLRPRNKLSHLDLAAGTALVLLGNNEGQSVRYCRLRDPRWVLGRRSRKTFELTRNARARRGWTAIQVREGDNLGCTGAIIEDNVIVRPPQAALDGRAG